MKRVNVIGLGYIGLPTASLIATKGYDVLGVDVSQKIVDTINRGEIHIVEPGLDILVKSAVNSKKLKAALKPEEADVHIIAVPTPFKEGFQPDLKFVESATLVLCDVLKAGDLVILESTSPVGATNRVHEIIKEKLPTASKNIFVAHSPERVIPGKVLQELVENDRVIGGVNEASTKKAVTFYKSFVSGQVIPTNAKTAEMCKLAENAFRDINIAYANELSLICDELGIDVWELISLANKHPRVNILQPGPGVGGHCIAVDPWFIVNKSPHLAQLTHQARKVNDGKPQWVVNKVIQKIALVENPVVACLGASFKANIDDLRESPALGIIHELQKKNIAEVLTVEPHVQELESVKLVSLDEALEKANIILVLVDHDSFKQIKASKFKNKEIVDTRGIISSALRLSKHDNSAAEVVY